MVLLPLSHFSQRSNTAHPPPHTEDFVLLQHSMSVMGDDHWGTGQEGGLPALAVSSSATGSVRRGLSAIAKCYLLVMRPAR